VHQDPANPHRVVVLALPHVVAFDLSIPAQIFGYEDSGYQVMVCASRAGQIETTTPGLSLQIGAGLEALAEAGTVIVPGFGFEHPASGPPRTGCTPTNWPPATRTSRSTRRCSTSTKAAC
jgi:hypothetical protein